MSEIIDVEKWLNTAPDESEVFSLQADGTGKYIPYEIVVEKLYQLCSHNWSDYNLRVTYTNLPDRRTMVSGTIEVEVNYKIGNENIKRRLAGGANFICNSSKIPHTTASIRSLAVMSTVKVLGLQFGWKLNEGEEPTPQELYNPEAAKQKEIAGFIEAIKDASSLKAVQFFKKTVDRENDKELTEAYILKVKSFQKIK
jgi:hypothetical protein